MNARDVIVAIDAGTSVLKAVAFSTDGVELGSRETPNRLCHPVPGWVEQDMASTWHECLGLVKRLLDGHAGLRSRVAALGVTAQGDGTWLVDKDGEPVGAALTWLDGRCAPVLEQLEQSGMGAAIARHTGTALSCSLQSVQLRWLARHDPSRLRRAVRALHCKDWLFFKLTGDTVSDLSESSFTFGEIEGDRCADDVLHELGLDEFAHLFPPVRDALTEQGALAEAPAAALGLPSGLPTILAPIDVVCAALGAGVLDDSGSYLCSILGTAGVHLRSYDERPGFGATPIGYTAPLERGRSWMRYASNMTASGNLDWLGEIVRDAASVACAAPSLLSAEGMAGALDRLAASGEPASVLYYPFLFPGGERAPFVNPKARAQFLGLQHDTRLADLVRAVFESIGVAARGCYATLAGPPPAEIRLAGGMTRSQELCRIFTDVVGCATRVSSRREPGAAGAAMVSAVNLGIYRNLRGATGDWVTPFLAADLTRPDTDLSRTYDALYSHYDLGYRSMSELWTALASSQTGAPQWPSA